MEQAPPLIFKFLCANQQTSDDEGKRQPQE